MDNVTIFNSTEFGDVRTLVIDNEPWFIGKDVAEILGYSNTRDALSKHVDEEDKNSVVIHDGTPGNPNQVIINESGVYSLILRSKLDSAKRFKHWVTSEVLPSLRKSGSYTMQQLRELENKAALFDRMSGGYENKNFRDSAKALDISQSQLTGWLMDNKMVYRREDGSLFPTPEFENSGFFKVASFQNKYSNYDGVRTLITPTGLAAFSHMLDAAGLGRKNMRKHGGRHV